MIKRKINGINKYSSEVLSDNNRLPRGGFIWLWVGETISLFGNQVTSVTVSLISIQILQVSEFEMGLLAAFKWIPVMLVGLLAGAWADRYNAWWIMFVSNISRALLIASIPVLYSLGKLNFLFILLSILIVETFGVFFDIAYQTFVPEIVDKQALISANSKLELSRSLSQIMGPAMAGLMTSWLSMPVILSLDAISFLIATLTLLPIPYWHRLMSLTNKKNYSLLNTTEPSIKKTIIDGINFVLKDRILLLSITSTSFCNFFASGATTLEILFASRKLGLPAQTIGLCISVSGATAIMSALGMAVISKKVGECRAIAIGQLLSLMGMLCLAFANQINGLMMFIVAQALFGFGGPLLNANLVTLRQKITPRHMLGSVNATARVVIMSSLPLGALFSGFSANIFGIQNSLILFGTGAALVFLVTAPILFSERPLK